ncbi:MAG: thioredoxin domain-containing protein, partial [Aureliella sp.]
DSRWGRPGFGQVLLAIVDAWQTKREQIVQQGAQIGENLQQACQGPPPSQTPLNSQWIAAADAWLIRHHDPQYGGFGGAPKFPHAMDLSLLVELSTFQPNEARTKAIHTTLDHMARGGIYDHLAGGFARYSVDARWLVPHFEKMLYDNALLVNVYADAYRLWGNPEYAQVVRETLDYILREMTDASGSFYSTEDADSEGVEGKFYVWTPAEIEQVLGAERGRQFCECYDVTEAGNFEESNILNLSKSISQFAALHQLEETQFRQQLSQDRDKLLQQRATRVRPSLDDKVLLSWNALMISAMTHGYRAIGDERYLQSAQAAVGFIRSSLRRADGRLWHTWRQGTPSLDAYLDDYAYLIDALTELFQVDGRAATLALAIELAESMIQHFTDPAGGFYFTADDHEILIARSKDLADSSVPSGNAMAAAGLLNLARLTGRNDFLLAAESALVAASGVMDNSPQAAAQSLRVLLRHLQPSQEYVLVAGSDASEFAEQRVELLKRLDPRALTVCLQASDDGAGHNNLEELAKLCPLVEHRLPVDSQATLYVCESFSCQQPIVGKSAIAAELNKS